MTSCHFQKELPEELDIDCPICSELLLDSPHLTDCCGRHFCGHCVSKLYTKNDTVQCPMCRSKKCRMVLDKSLERLLGNQYVYCTHWNANDISNGCQWEGELKNLNVHIYDTCLYVNLECPHYGCQQVIKRYEYREHVKSLCPQRPYTCEYCHLNDTYLFITSHHYKACNFYPVDCPLECSATIPRCDVISHIDNDCPLQPVSCVYHMFGCDEQPARKDLKQHILSPHHDIVVDTYSKLMDRIKRLEIDFHRTVASKFDTNEKKINKLETQLNQKFKIHEGKVNNLIGDLEEVFKEYKREKELQQKIFEQKLIELNKSLSFNRGAILFLFVIILLIVVL